MNLIKTFYLKLIVLTFFGSNYCDLKPEDNVFGSDQQFANLRQDFDLLAKDFLESLKVAHKLVDTDDDDKEDKEEELIRSKRSAKVYHQNGDQFYTKGLFRLRAIVPLHSTCDRPLDFTTVPFNRNIYGICVSQSTGPKTPAKVTVGALTPSGWDRNGISWTVKDPKNVVSFVDSSNLYVLVADAGSDEGTNLNVIDSNNRYITKERLRVNSHYPTAIAVFLSPTDDKYHLLIANSYGSGRTAPDGSYRSQTYAYKWVNTYFDRYTEMTTYLVKDICPFRIHSVDYLAVANFEAGPNSPVVDSEIYRLDINAGKWRSFQRIVTSGAVDWEFFTLGSGANEEYFLAVANNYGRLLDGRTKYDVNSVIYKYTDDGFVPHTVVPTVGATQVTSYRGAEGEFVLAVADNFQAVHLYQYNGRHFVETTVQYKTGVMSRGVVSLHFDYLPFERSGVLFVSNPHHPNGHFFRMEFVHENPLGEWYNKSLHWCEATDREVKLFGEEIHRILFNDVFFVDQNQPIEIRGDLNMADLTVDSLQTPILVDLTTGDELSHRLIDELAKLEEEIRSAEQKLGQIVDILSNAMRTTGEQVVTAPQTYHSVDFQCRPENDCFFNQITAKVLNNDNINGLAEDIIPLNIDQTIDQSMHFQSLKIDQNLILKGLINGHNSSHIVTKHGSHDILMPKTFLNDVTANEVNSNLINQKVINPSTVLLTIGDQVINNSIKFVDIILPNLQVNGPVNGLDINKFYAQVVTRDTDYIIRGEKRFNHIIGTDLFMRPESTIDGVDIMKIWNEVLWTYSDQEVSVPINFTDIMISSDLHVDGLVNGISIPNDIILTNQNVMISGNKRFLSPVKANRVSVLHSLNGIGLVNRAEQALDLMLKSKEQLVLGQKIFSQIHLGGHTTVRGNVDGVKLSELKRTLIMRNTSQHFDVLEIRGNAIFKGGLDLKTTINGLKLEDFYIKALKLTDRLIPAFPHFQMNVANFGSLECLSINGLNIGADLMTKNTPQVISGQKTFVNGIRVNNDLLVRHINGIDMTFINDTLLHDGQQYITGEKTFANDLWVKNLITDTINNVSINDIVLLNGDQTIPSPKIFTDVHIYRDMNVESIDSNVINGIQMRELFDNSLQYERPQKMTGRLNVESITIPKGTYFETNSVNGIDFKKLMSDAVLIDIPQKISGIKTFIAPTTIERTHFVHSFDNVTDYDLKHNWLLQDTTQTVNSDLIFDNKTIVDNKILMRIPVINNVNLELLNNNTVKVDEPALITGQSIRFIAPVISEGHIELSGRIQGIDLDKEAVTLDRDNIINGEIHFFNGFEVDEHLFTNGTVDGVRVEDLCRYAVRSNVNQVITGPTTVTGDLLIKGPLDINHTLNGIKLEEFARNVLKRDEPSAVKGIKHFRQLVIDGPVLTKELFAGFRIDELFDNYLSLSRDQSVNSKIVFINNLDINRHLTVKGNVFTQNSVINGIDLHRLDSTVLKTIGDQLISGDFTFEENVVFDKDLDVVSRRVNDLDLFRDLMLKGRNNTVFAPKIFAENLKVVTNLDVRDGMAVGGVDLSEMFKYSVLKTNGKYRIGGHKHFQSLEVDHLKVRHINGWDMSDRSLLLSYGNQRINAHKVLRNGLTANKEINSLAINGINIRNMSSSLVLKGHNNTINAMKSFHSPLTVNNVNAFGRVDGVDLNELDYFIKLPINLHDLEVKLGIEDQKIQIMQRALDKQSVQLEFYELVSTIHSGPPLLSYYNSITGSQHLFISGQQLANGCQEVVVYSQTRVGIESIAKLFAIEANLMTSFRWNGNQFVVISNVKKPIDSVKCLQMNDSPTVLHYGRGPTVSQVFVFDERLRSYKQMAVINSESVTDLKVIEDNNRYPCLLLAIPVVDNSKLGHPVILCMNSNGNFYLKDTIPEVTMFGTDQISIVRSSSYNRTLMASINSWQTSKSMSNIEISDWSSHLSQFQHSIQTIPVLSPSTVHLVESLIHSSIFLFSTEKKTSLTHNPLVRIFRFHPRQRTPFVLVQQIRDLEVKQIESIVLDDHKILVLMLSTDRLDLYRLKGSSGFVRVDTIDVKNAQNFIVSQNYRNNRISGHLISISLKLCYARNRNICKEETHVLRPKFNIN